MSNVLEMDVFSMLPYAQYTAASQAVILQLCLSRSVHSMISTDKGGLRTAPSRIYSSSARAADDQAAETTSDIIDRSTQKGLGQRHAT
jgi:hypothetical protein